MARKHMIINGLVFREKGAFEPATVYFCDDRIVSEETWLSTEGEETLTDAEGCYVIPGLTDIHFHGCMGSDCCDGTEEAFRVIARYQLRRGVTSITPATLTMPEEVLAEICRAARDFSCEDGADLCGLYMEGPFISPAKKGAQNEKYIHPADTEMLKRLQQLSGGMIRTVTVAPETEGAMDFIRENSGSVNISLAHTAADYDTAREALACGASQLTHTYNAMMPFSHRAPGPIGAAADSSHCMAELICDGIHVHPAVVRTTFKMFGDDRIILISDSLRATGLCDGQYELGGQTVTVRGNRAVLEDGTIAGSVTDLMGCVRIVVRDMGIPLASAVKCAAVNPAKAIGIYRDYGSLTPGKYANVAILDQDLELIQVFHRSEIVRPATTRT
ncbi:MAG: N-acetylglucosamine-6-phosphate deacetylase [Eubacterium sp.]|nr:N-acetylglucosamine-6-phosphate deacetylase [Eubacterium sp.]MCM1215511.1 N-acetylglucosamine-6-phosphate deacetylase [Lachnospiraceae bacterium]MCM1239308.1 N-acetylglucosamine-6-phosphate deacetylase [Lachnospiraceae bacterium]